MVQALTGVNDGSFTRLEVLDGGTMKNVLELVGEATYDDTQLALDVSANTSSAAANASTLSQHATAIAGKADSSSVYSQATIDAMVAPQATLALTTLKFADIDAIGVNTLTVEGGDYIAIEDASGAALLDLDAAQVTITPPTNCLSSLNVTGQLTANNLSSTSLQAQLAGKQATLSNAVYLDATSSVQTQLNGKQATLSNAAYLDATSSVQTQLNGKQATLSNASYLDATSSVQTQLNGKQATLSNAAYLDATSSVQTQLNARYTQTQVDDRLNDKADSATTYTIAQVDANTYTQSQVDDRLNDKADSATTYTIAQVDANTYTQSQVDDRLDDKADSADLLQVYSGSSTWVEPTKMHFANSSFALDVAPGSATQGAWVVESQPPISSVVGLTSALANKAAANNATIGTALTVGGTGNATLHLQADSDDTSIYEEPWLTWSKEGVGNVAMRMGIISGRSCIIDWDSNSVGGHSQGWMMYFGIRHQNAWQTWVTDTTNSWATASDARLKTVLAPLENCTAKLSAINPCYFEYKADKSKKRRIGLIAQECQKDFPEVVNEGPEDKMLGMCYGDMVPVLIQAIKELTVRIEGLEGRRKKK